jgi:hypothetical protein
MESAGVRQIMCYVGDVHFLGSGVEDVELRTAWKKNPVALSFLGYCIHFRGRGAQYSRSPEISRLYPAVRANMLIMLPLVFGFELVATDGAVGGAQVTRFPR